MIRLRTAALVVGLAALAVALQSAAAFPPTWAAAGRLAGFAVALAFVALGLAGWGSLVAVRLGEATAELRFACGLTVVGSVLGALARVWVPGRLATVALLAVGCLVLLWLRSRARPAARFDWSAGPWSLTLPFVLPALLLALAPPISLDALVYHLTVPRQALLDGAITEMPWSVHTALARLMEGIFGLTLALEPWGILAQLLSLSCAVATCMALARLGDRIWGTSAGVWAAVLVISMPALTVVAGWAWTDWGVMLLAALAVDRWWRFAEGGDERHLLAAGLLVGAAAAVKYTALPLLVLPLLARFDGATWRQSLRSLALALVPALPWTVHNLSAHRNPLYPLFTEVASELGLYRGEAGLLARLRGYFGRPDLLDESLGVVLFPALVLALVLRVAPWKRHRTLYLQGGLFALAGLVFHPTVRSFAPALVIVCLLGGGGIAAGADALARRGTLRRLATAALALGLAINFLQVLWIFERYAPVSAAVGFEAEEDYLRSGQDYYSSFERIERHTPPGSGVLVVGESRVFHLDRPVLAGSYLDPLPIHFLRSGECDVDCLAEALRGRGISTVFVRRDRLVVDDGGPAGTDELRFRVDHDDLQALTELLGRYGRKVHQQGPIELWALSSRLNEVAPDRPQLGVPAAD